MMLRRHLIAALIGVAGLAAPIGVMAHDAHYGLTSIEWNPNTRRVEVIHRFHAHHVIELIEIAKGAQVSSLDAPADQAYFFTHLAQSFDLRDAEGSDIALTTLGGEAQGDFFFIYQESAVMDAPARYGVRHDAFAEMFPGQINQVNVSLSAARKTLIFSNKRRGVFLSAK